MFCAYAQHRGFLFTLEAMLCLLAVVNLSSVLFLIQERENLNDFLLTQLAQDAMEVCARTDFTERCFGHLRDANSALHYTVYENGKYVSGDDTAVDYIKIKRSYANTEIELRVWI